MLKKNLLKISFYDSTLQNQKIKKEIIWTEIDVNTQFNIIDACL